MALYYETRKGNFALWQPGKFIKDKLPGNIETAWSDEELAARRLYRPAPAEPMPQGKLLKEQRVERIDGVVRYVEETEDAPLPTLADYSAAVQALLDGEARARDYRSIESAVSYLGSTVAEYAAEASAFLTWRDAVWQHAYTALAEVTDGTRPQPSIEAFIEELPAIVLPA